MALATGERLLFLTREPALVARQLAGDALSYSSELELASDVSTDEMAPAWGSYFYDERLGEHCLTGFRGGAIGLGAVREGGFGVLVAGANCGCGSSRETAPYAQLLAGIRHGLDSAGLVRVNDPEDPRYKNTTDVASGGKEKTANLLADFAQLDGLVPFNDETMLGAVEALREAGRLGEVKMVSRNGTPAAVQLIRAGVHHGTWDIDPPGIGQSVASLVVRSATEDLDGLCVSSPVGRMITPDRAAAWIPWRERIPYHDLKPA